MSIKSIAFVCLFGAVSLVALASQKADEQDKGFKYEKSARPIVLQIAADDQKQQTCNDGGRMVSAGSTTCLNKSLHVCNGKTGSWENMNKPC